MQGLFCARGCLQPLQDRVLFSKIYHASHFASRTSSSFTGFTPGKASASQRHATPKPKTSDSNATGPSASPRKAPRQKSAKEAKAEAPPKPEPRSRIGPGKIILFSIIVYVGYKIRTWQINPARSLILNPRFFTPFILESRDIVSSTSAILDLLSLPRGQNTEMVSEAWRKGVWSVEVIQPELQVVRSYTPLPPNENTEPEEVRLFVRKEPQGEVSSFLHRIARGTLVHLRGPRLEYEIPEDVDEVLFLAGGTGIAPALQIAHTLFNYRKKSPNGPELRILWANRTREDSIDRPSLQPPATAGEVATPSESTQNRLVEEVESLKAKHGGKLIVDYFIDEESSYITESLLRTYLSGVDQTANQDGTPRTKVVLVSGPDGFVDAFAGPKKWQSGKEIQGPLGGLLKKIDPQGWEIWKL